MKEIQSVATRQISLGPYILCLFYTVDHRNKKSHIITCSIFNTYGHLPWKPELYDTFKGMFCLRKSYNIDVKEISLNKNKIVYRHFGKTILICCQIISSLFSGNTDRWTGKQIYEFVKW